MENNIISLFNVLLTNPSIYLTGVSLGKAKSLSHPVHHRTLKVTAPKQKVKETRVTVKASHL